MPGVMATATGMVDFTNGFYKGEIMRKINLSLLTTAFLGLPSFFCSRSVQVGHEIDHRLREMAKVTGTHYTEAYLNRLKSEAYAQTQINGEYILERVTRRQYIVKIVTELKIKWDDFMFKCFELEVSTEQLFDFVLLTGTLPKDGESIGIKHFGIEGIMQAIREEQFNQLQIKLAEYGSI